MIKNQKETAIQDEQQLKSKQDIINEIIKIISENNLTVNEARKILQFASHKLGNQQVTVSSY